MLRRLAPALLLATACLSAPPVHPRALENNELCAQMIGAGDLVRADVYCDHGLEFSPQYADLWVNKGLIALRAGQNAKAKEFFIKALRFNQEQAQAYNNLGFVYYKDKECGKAHDSFARALKVNPDYTEARYNLALSYICLKEREKAKKELRTIIAVNGNLADPHHHLGVLLLEEGAVEEAIASLSNATQLSPDFDDAWLNLGNAYSEAGKYPEARDAYGACVEINATNALCRNNLAIIARKAALQEPQLKEIKENMASTDTAAGIYQNARIFREKGLRNEEERAYRKCLKKDGQYALCHYGLFEIFKEERRDADAKVACKNFLKFADAAELPEQTTTCEKHVGTN